MNSKNNENKAKDYDFSDSTDTYDIKIVNTINKTDEMVDAEKKLTEELKK